jgi:hypothetical protein
LSLHTPAKAIVDISASQIDKGTTERIFVKIINFAPLFRATVEYKKLPNAPLQPDVNPHRKSISMHLGHGY